LGGSWFEASTGKKLTRPYLNIKTRCDTYTCDLRYMEDIGRRIVFLNKPGRKGDPI
jgi:hypothetical protein